MAVTNLGFATTLRESLAQIREEGERERERIARTGSPRAILSAIRGIPVDDKRKKQELARLFQGPAGARFSRSDRKEMYDELLGRSRNRRQIG